MAPPDKTVASIRKRFQARITKWRKALADRIEGARAKEKRRIKKARKAGSPELRMFDSVTVSEIPRDAEAAAGYTSGLYPTFSHLRAQCPNAKLLSIAVASTHNDAECLDIEPGDATPADAAAWVKRAKARGIKTPVVYTSVSAAKALIDVLARAGIPRSGYRIWTAHYTGSPHLCDASCGFGDFRADATQFTDHSGGRNLDESVCAPGFFD